MRKMWTFNLGQGHSRSLKVVSFICSRWMTVQQCFIATSQRNTLSDSTFEKLLMLKANQHEWLWRPTTKQGTYFVTVLHVLCDFDLWCRKLLNLIFIWNHLENIYFDSNFKRIQNLFHQTLKMYEIGPSCCVYPVLFTAAIKLKW